MKTNIPLIRPLVLSLLVLASFVTTTLAQEVQIPDPGLNAAIREALEKPIGPLTEQDLLRLINLDAFSGISVAWKGWEQLVIWSGCFLTPIACPISPFPAP